MENNEKIKIITEVAIITAIAFGLDYLQGGLSRGLFTNGGSIGVAMIPIMLLAFRRGYIPALISGFILSTIQMVGGVYAIANSWYNVLLQVALDYILAYPLVAQAGLFYKKFQNAKTSKERIGWIIIGCVLGGMLKYVSHVLSGALFFSDLSYSLLYNGAYMIPNTIICTTIMVLILLKAPQLFLLPNKEDNKEATINE